MKEKVMKILKPLFASKGFKTDELESIADILSGNLTNESTDEEITKIVEAFVPTAELMQKIGNRYASGVESKYKGWKSQEEIDKELEKAKAEAVETYKKLNPVPPIPKGDGNNNPEPPKQDPPAPKQEPKQTFPDYVELFTKMQTQQREFQDALQKQTAELISKGVADALRPYNETKERERLATLLNSNDKVKAIPAEFRSFYKLEKEEDLDGLVEKMTNDYAQLRQSMIQSEGFATPPASGRKNNDDDVLNFLNGMAKKENK